MDLTTAKKTIIGLPKTLFWITIIVVTTIVGFFVRQYYKNHDQVNNLVNDSVNSI